MRSMGSKVGLVLFASLAACGRSEDGALGGEGGALGGEGGALGGEGGAAGGACTVQGDGDPTVGDICAGLDHLAVTLLEITEEDNDGRITIGEVFTTTFELRDVSGFGFDHYPGVTYEVEPAGIAVSPTSDFAAYALHPCESMQSGTRLVLGSTIGPGTMIEVTARAAALNQDCPNAPSQTIRVTVVE